MASPLKSLAASCCCLILAQGAAAADSDTHDAVLIEQLALSELAIHQGHPDAAIDLLEPHISNIESYPMDIRGRLLFDYAEAVFAQEEGKPLYWMERAIVAFKRAYGEGSCKLVEPHQRAAAMHREQSGSLAQYNRFVNAAAACHGERSVGHYLAMVHAAKELMTAERMTDTPCCRKNQGVYRLLRTAYKGLRRHHSNEAYALAQSAYHQGRYFFRIKRYSQALAYAKEAVDTYTEAGLPTNKFFRQTHRLLIRAASHKREFELSTDSAKALAYAADADDHNTTDILYFPDSRIPAKAQWRRLTGVVELVFDISESGRAFNVRVVGGENLAVFRDSAVETISDSQFLPYFSDGSFEQQPQRRAAVRYEAGDSEAEYIIALLEWLP